MYTYKAKIVRVVDADTIDMMVDVGFTIKVNQRFRIARLGGGYTFDAPETHRPKSNAERDHGVRASCRSRELLPIGSTVTVTTYNDKAGIYGRYSASIELPNGVDYASLMIAEGFRKRDKYPKDS